MSSGSSPGLRKLLSGLMLLAMAAFVQQGTLIAVSHAAAAVGSMPQPALILHGSVHLHDNLAGHMHTHGGDQAAGHVHGNSGPDDDHADDMVKAPFCSIGGATAFVAGNAVWAAPPHVSMTVESADNLRGGVEPDRLSRPPSIPSIG
jgi:hypothetical protein